MSTWWKLTFAPFLWISIEITEDSSALQVRARADLQSQLPGPRFTNGFFITIQIRWKVPFAFTSIPTQRSLQNFVHAVLSWHLKNFVTIRWPGIELLEGEVSIEFELPAKNGYWNGLCYNQKIFEANKHKQAKYFFYCSLFGLGVKQKLKIWQM